MKIRMVPVDQLFRRFPRLVRDTAKACGKDIVMTVSGAEPSSGCNLTTWGGEEDALVGGLRRRGTPDRLCGAGLLSAAVPGDLRQR